MDTTPIKKIMEYKIELWKRIWSCLSEPKKEPKAFETKEIHEVSIE